MAFFLISFTKRWIFFWKVACFSISVTKRWPFFWKGLPKTQNVECMFFWKAGVFFNFLHKIYTFTIFLKRGRFFQFPSQNVEYFSKKVAFFLFPSQNVEYFSKKVALFLSSFTKRVQHFSEELAISFKKRVRRKKNYWTEGSSYFWAKKQKGLRLT